MGLVLTGDLKTVFDNSWLPSHAEYSSELGAPLSREADLEKQPSNSYSEFEFDQRMYEMLMEKELKCNYNPSCQFLLDHLAVLANISRYSIFIKADCSQRVLFNPPDYSGPIELLRAYSSDIGAMYQWFTLCAPVGLEENRNRRLIHFMIGQDIGAPSLVKGNQIPKAVEQLNNDLIVPIEKDGIVFGFLQFESNEMPATKQESIVAFCSLAIADIISWIKSKDLMRETMNIETRCLAGYLVHAVCNEKSGIHFSRAQSEFAYLASQVVKCQAIMCLTIIEDSEGVLAVESSQARFFQKMTVEDRSNYLETYNGYHLRITPVDVGRNIVAAVYYSNQAEVVNDPELSQSFNQNFGPFRTYSIGAFPISNSNSQVIGINLFMNRLRDIPNCCVSTLQLHEVFKWDRRTFHFSEKDVSILQEFHQFAEMAHETKRSGT